MELVMAEWFGEDFGQRMVAFVESNGLLEWSRADIGLCVGVCAALLLFLGTGWWVISAKRLESSPRQVVTAADTLGLSTELNTETVQEAASLGNGSHAAGSENVTAPTDSAEGPEKAVGATGGRTEEETAPVVAEVQEETAPVVTEVQEETAPVVTEVQEKTSPVVTEVQEETAPVVIEVQEETAPVVAKVQEEMSCDRNTGRHVEPVDTRVVAEELPQGKLAL